MSEFKAWLANPGTALPQEFELALRNETVNTYWYLATSYSKHPEGLQAAFEMAVRAAGVLSKAGVPVFSPIAHTHPIAMLCNMDPLDHTIWLPVDQPLIDAAHGIIVLRDGGWEESYGIAHERKCFMAAGKPELFMDTGEVPVELRA